MVKNTFLNLDKEKQDMILQAALEEFANKTFSKVTIDGIVNKAGISKGSYYQYFDNKTDLYKFLFVQLSGDKKSKLKLYLKEMKGKGFSVFIRELYTQGTKFDLSDATYMGIHEKFMKNCRVELRDEILELMEEDSNALFEDVLSYYISTGELKKDLNIELLAEMLTTLTIFIGKRLVKMKKVTEEEIVKAINDMLCVIELGILRS